MACSPNAEQSFKNQIEASSDVLTCDMDKLTRQQLLYKVFHVPKIFFSYGGHLAATVSTVPFMSSSMRLVFEPKILDFPILSISNYFRGFINKGNLTVALPGYY